MARVFVTGSSDGIGLAAARLLVEQGHTVTLHARTAARAQQARLACPQAADVLIGDLSDLGSIKRLAEDANRAGPWDAVVHNAGVYHNDSRTDDGFATTFVVNSLAPYMLTALMTKPRRLLYLSSGLHYGGSTSLDDLAWTTRKTIDSHKAYNDTKLQDIILANAVASRWPDVQSCSFDPGWTSTRMGGQSAPVPVDVPAKTVALYAAGEHELASKSGQYFTSRGIAEPVPMTKDATTQARFLEICQELSGISFPS